MIGKNNVDIIPDTAIAASSISSIAIRILVRKNINKMKMTSNTMADAISKIILKFGNYLSVKSKKVD